MRLLFATDLHGSSTVFRKAIAATIQTNADVFLMGGDVSGKQMVPILRAAGDRYTVLEPYRENADGFLVDRVRSQDISGAELAAFFSRLESKGHYWHVVDDPSVIEQFNEEPDTLRHLWSQKIVERLAAWSTIALEELPAGVQCIWSGGNDDETDALERAKAFSNSAFRHSEGDIVAIDDYDFMSFGVANETPFRTPREATEDVIYDALNAEADKARSSEKLIMNVHVPPFEAGNLDLCPEYKAINRGAHDSALSTEPEQQYQPTGRKIAVGSKGVSRFIQERQPIADFVGHVHEGKGVFRMGRTYVFNAGSDYSAGVLQAFLVTLVRGAVDHYSHLRR